MSRMAAAFGVVVVMSLGLGCGEGGEGGSPTMRPGEDCLGCHVAGGKAGEATFSAAGTVLHGDGSAAPGLNVTLTDSAGTQASEVTNSVGNFYFEQPLTPPLQVTITDGATILSMQDALGDCNGCHQAGGSAQTHIFFN